MRSPLLVDEVSLSGWTQSGSDEVVTCKVQILAASLGPVEAAGRVALRFAVIDPRIILRTAVTMITYNENVGQSVLHEIFPTKC